MGRLLHQWVMMAAAAMLCAMPMLRGVEVPAEVDKMFRSYVELPTKLVPLLARAQDKESAEAVAEALQRVLPYVYDLRHELAKIQSLDPAVGAEVRRRYEKDMRARWGEVYDLIARVEAAGHFHAPAFSRQFTILCMLLER